MRSRRKDWESIEREKMNLISGKPIDESKVEPFILESWKRSIQYGVDPYMSKLIVSEASAVSANPHLFIDTRQIEDDGGILKMLNDYAMDTGMIIEVTNHQGKLIKVLAKSSMEYTSVLDDAENVLGTNAVCLALLTRQPIQIFGPEHFNVNISNSDCSTAPIRDLDGSIIGTLNIAARRTRHNETTLLLAKLLAGILEDYLLIYNYKGMLDSYDSALSSVAAELCETRAAKSVNRIGYSRSVKDTQDKITKKMSWIKEYENRRNAFYRNTIEVRLFGCYEPETGGSHSGGDKSSVNNNWLNNFGDIIGESDELVSAKRLALKIAPSSASVLIFGESGTGKELFAQSIHSASNRKNGPFISINCGAIPNELVESEFFGYEAGSFTGGLKQGKQGKLVAASGGTLFLDEIESMPLNVQVKLLRVFSTGRVIRIGGTEEIPVDIRVISATKKNLEIECLGGRFREDLMFRINVITLPLPPLRDRQGDIPLLVRAFVDRFSEMRKSPPIDIEQRAMNALQLFNWLGNIRQLKNVIERAIILMDRDNIITFDNLPEAIRDMSGKAMFREAKANADNRTGILRQMEELSVRKTLLEENKNVTRAAKRLGISRSMLYRTFKNVLDEFGQ